MTAGPALAGAGLTVCREPAPVPAHLRGAVIAIGNFDGLHRGHKALVAAAEALAAEDGRPAAVLTFDPHPRVFFRPDQPTFLLTGEAEKLRILAGLGLDAAFIRRFDKRLAETAAADFVRDLLGRDLGASSVVVGTNFRFGRGREGSPASLAGLAAESGIGCRVIPPVAIDGAPVSSSRIRDALRTGDVAFANRLLGYRWFVCGTVRGGDRRGRTLGFPTANMALDPACGLAHGIYAVRIALGPDEVREGVASFGRRPTFDDGAPLLETFVFDFAGDLYGRDVAVEFVGWIRGEERFPSAEALTARMHLDAEAARALLAAAPPGETSFIL